MATPMPAADFLWEGGGSYGVSVANLLSTELNALVTSSTNTLSTLGTQFQNTNMRIYGDVEFLAGAGLTTVTGGFIEVWFLRSLDGGSNYEDGTASVAPGRGADVILPVRQGSNITPRSGMPLVVLPPSFYKPIARNQTGTTLPATSNILRYVQYSPAY